MASRNDGCLLRLMEFKNFIFQAWKFIKILLTVLGSHRKLKFCLENELLQMSNRGQCTVT